MSRWLPIAALAIPVFTLMSGSGHAQDAGRLLASNCFQCHGTNGKGGFERLAGESAAEIYNELKEMQGNPALAERDKEIMVVHANGFTDAELKLLANFFAKQ
jgi:cytochrome c553